MVQSLTAPESGMVLARHHREASGTHAFLPEDMTMPHRKPWSELSVLALAIPAILIAAAVATALHSAQAWTLVAVLVAGYALSRGTSRNDWPAAQAVSAPAPSPAPAPSSSRPAPQPDGDAVEVVAAEEQLQVDKRRRPHERVRLRREVVTEEVTITVPLRREVVRIERIPIEPGTAGELDGLGAFTEGEIQELVLMEEQAVVDKRVVPRERVRLAKDVVTEEQQITRALRREQVDVDREPSPDAVTTELEEEHE
jgi:uncharacterized protein (TIGR02271 family)